MKRGQDSCCSGAFSRRDFLKRVGAGAAAAPFVAGPFQKFFGVRRRRPLRSRRQEAQSDLAADSSSPRVTAKFTAVVSARRSACPSAESGPANSTSGVMAPCASGASRTSTSSAATAPRATSTASRRASSNTGFAVAVTDGHGKTRVRRLREEDVPEVEFVGEYPIAEIRYPAGDFADRGEHARVHAFHPAQRRRQHAAGDDLPGHPVEPKRQDREGVAAQLDRELRHASQRRDCSTCRSHQHALRQDGKATHMACLCGHKPWWQERWRTGSPTGGLRRFREGSLCAGGRPRGDAFATSVSRGANGTQNPVRGFLGKGLLNSFTSSRGDSRDRRTLTSPRLRDPAAVRQLPDRRRQGRGPHAHRVARRRAGAIPRRRPEPGAARVAQLGRRGLRRQRGRRSGSWTRSEKGLGPHQHRPDRVRRHTRSEAPAGSSSKPTSAPSAWSTSTT